MLCKTFKRNDSQSRTMHATFTGSLLHTDVLQHNRALNSNQQREIMLSISTGTIMYTSPHKQKYYGHTNTRKYCTHDNMRRRWWFGAWKRRPVSWRRKQSLYEHLISKNIIPTPVFWSRVSVFNKRKLTNSLKSSCQLTKATTSPVTLTTKYLTHRVLRN